MANDKKKIIIEIEDPYSSNVTNFARTSGGLTLTQVSFNQPGQKPSQTDYNQDGTIKPATPYEVIRKLDLDSENVSCIDDLKENWVHYLGFGLFVAWSIKPVMGPLLSLGAKSGNFLWKTGAGALTSKGQNIVTIGKSLKPIVKKIPNVKIIDPIRWVKALPAGAKWWLAADEFSKAKNALMTSKGSLFARGASAAGRGLIWAPVQIMKRSFLVALCLLIAYEGLGLKKFLNWGKGSDIDLIAMGFEALDTGFNYIMMMDMAVEHIALLSNSNLNKDCVITNAIVSSILASFLLPMTSQSSRALYKLEELEKLKTGDDFVAFVKSEKGLLIANFTENLTNNLRAAAKKAGINDDLLRTYLETFYRNENNALKLLKNRGIKDADSFHSSAIKIYNKEEAIFAARMSKTASENNKLIQGAKNSEEMDKTRQIGKNLLNRSLQTFRNMNKDPRLASQASNNIRKSTNTGKMTDDFHNVNKLSGFNTIEETSKSLLMLERALESGEISIRTAASVYASGFSRNLSAFSDELVKLMNLPKDVSKMSTSKRIEEISRAYADLAKSQDNLRKALNLMAPNGKPSPHFWQKLFNTKNAKRAKQVDKLLDAREAVRMAKSEILKLRPNMSMADLAKLDNSIESTYKALFKAHGAGSTSLTYEIGNVIRQVSIVGVLVALTGVVGRTFFVDDSGDLETWQKTEIARALAWEGVFPKAVLETVYLLQKPGEWLGLVKEPEKTEITFQKALISIVQNLLDSPPDSTSGNPRVLKEIYEKIIFHQNDKLLSEIADSQSLDPISIVNKLRLQKSDYSTVLWSLIHKFGANDQGFGMQSLSGDDKQIAFRKLWYPPIMSIMIANSGILVRLNGLKNSKFYQSKSKPRKIEFLKKEIFVFKNPDDVTDHLQNWVNKYKFMIQKKYNVKLREVKFMKKQKEKQNAFLQELVKETLKENYGSGYNPYPYNSHIGDEDEHAEDFQKDWKDFELSLVRDESRETAIKIAKVLVRDLELFGDVLDLVGQNQSVATEILRKIKEKEES